MLFNKYKYSIIFIYIKFQLKSLTKSLIYKLFSSLLFYGFNLSSTDYF